MGHGRLATDSTTVWGRLVELVGPDPLELAEKGLADVRAREKDFGQLADMDVPDELREAVAGVGGALADQRHYWLTVQRQARRAIAGKSVDMDRVEKAARRYRRAWGRQDSLHRMMVDRVAAREAA